MTTSCYCGEPVPAGSICWKCLALQYEALMLKVQEWAKQRNHFDNYMREAAKEVLVLLNQDPTTPTWEDEINA